MFDATGFARDAEKVIEVTKQDLSSVRTGRAKPSLVEQIVVDAYGSRMKIVELASISAPEPTTLVISPWDTSVLPAIEKAISASDLHIPPVVEGDHIRLSIPTLTQERREEMVRLVKQKIESGKSMIRDTRQRHKRIIEDQKGQPGISEDTIKKDLEDLQKATDQQIERLEELGAQKEQELIKL